MDHEELEQQLHKLQKDFAGLCGLVAAQQQVIEKLGVAVDGHQRVLEAATGYQAPDAGKSSRN